MDKSLGVFFGLGAVIIIVLAFIPVDSAIPPTPAIKNVMSNDTTYSTVGGTYVADDYKSDQWFLSDGSILIEFINYTGGVQ